MNIFRKKASVQEKESTNKSLTSVESFYDNYKSRTNERIEQEGIEKFCKDIGIDPLDPIILVLSYHMHAKEMGVFTKSEFIEGMNKLGCQDLASLKKYLPKIKQELDDPKTFKEIYHYTFQFARENNKKCLNFTAAQMLWSIFFEKKYPLQTIWNDFLTDLAKKNDITEDQWRMYYEFLITTKGAIKNYKEEEAWPIIIDEFVDYCRKKNLL